MPRRSSAALPFSETATRIRPPDDLTGDARTVFVDLVTSTRADHFQESDIPTLAIFCEAVVLAKAASAGLKADGFVMADGKPSGWLPIQQAASRTVSTYSRMLRLNPSARVITPSPSPEPAPPPMSYYAKQRLLEARDDDDAAN
jgi:phage terminase small subunit